MSLELNATREIDWIQSGSPVGLTPLSVFFGHGDGASAFQVATAFASSEPSRSDLKSLYLGRKGKLTVSLIVAVECGETVHLFGPEEESQPTGLKKAVAKRFLDAVLAQPNSLLAYKRAMSLLRSAQTTAFTGFVNNGLFSSYLIREKVIERTDWSARTSKAKAHVGLRHRSLIESLGFVVEATPQQTMLLKAGSDVNRVVAILLDQNETFEGRTDRFQASPVEWGLMVAAERKAPWVIALREDQIRLYPALDGVGVGQKSQVETYFEIDLLAIDDDKLGFLELIFTATALESGGTAEQLLEESHRFATSLGLRLRERVYESVVPGLSVAVASKIRDLGHELDAAGLDFAYKLTLRILFRLLFQAYAEDRGLLPAGRNERFDKNSLKSWTDSFLKRDPELAWGESSSIWFDLLQVWNAIDEGNPDMGVPAYNGGLFGSNPDMHAAGALIKQLELRDKDLGPALSALLIDETEDGVPGAVDFRSLSVREFGTIYEGLLESSLSLAKEDLTVDKAGAWVPAKPGEPVLAEKDAVYFHNASGERKATGSYYTPAFVVNHLVRRSVEPAIKAHLEAVRILIQKDDLAGAYRTFFDFRVADLAMGSGHFLVAAIDNIEMHMRAFLSQPANFIPGVVEEMERLEQAAKDALGLDVAAFQEIERSSLLRRQIARRCIYGLDINELAVELSRLAIWIHTFVPGLPMSSLDHGLVCGNSLTGIATVDEALDVLVPGRKGQAVFFSDVVESSLDNAKDLLLDSASKTEATKAEVKQAASAASVARENAQVARDVFDVAVAARLGTLNAAELWTTEQLSEAAKRDDVVKLIDSLNPAHLPYLFPEVFLRDKPGFDALVGNPPFQEVVVEELQFWSRRFPGLKAKSNAEQQSTMLVYREKYPELCSEFEAEQQTLALFRRALNSSAFPGMGTGDVDLYKAFAWRFLDLVRVGGALALVLPNSIWNTQGNALWRKALISKGRSEIVLVTNKDVWVFENVNPGYRFTFVSLEKGLENLVSIRGTFSSKQAFENGLKSEAVIVTPQQLIEADPEVTIPSFQSTSDFNLWLKMIKFPPIGDGRLGSSRRDIQVAPMRELDATLDGKKKGIFTNNPEDHPVFNHLNVGSLSWEESIGAFNYAQKDPYVDLATQDALKLCVREGSAYSMLTPDQIRSSGHPILNPRIVFRDVVHSTNQRKVWVSLAPKGVLLTNKAPYLIFRGTPLEAQAYLLGLLSSGIVDWFGHSRIGLSLNFFIFYTIPVPTWTPDNRLMNRVAELATGLSLASPGDFGDWVTLASPISLQEDRTDSHAEIDGIATLLYGLDDDEVKIVFDGSNQTRSKYEMVMKYREQWRNE